MLGFDSQQKLFSYPLACQKHQLYNNYYIGDLMLSFKVTTVGSSAGFILTKEAMAYL